MARYTAPVQRPLRLVPVIAFAALVVPLLAASLVDACPRSHGRYSGGQPAANCGGQRIGPVTFSVRTSHPLVTRDQRSRTHLEVKLRAHAVQNVRRRPLNVALVLDRSGSMRGDKMRDAKEAARKLVRLLAPGDVLSVVSYSDDVRVDWPAKRFVRHDQRRILRVIDAMQATGSTFLEGGMREGAKQIERHMDGQMVSRVILVSDGNANIGVRNGAALGHIARRQLHGGIATTTVGLGLDYNEDTMTAIADGGAGSYYYVRESTDLGSTFRDEMRRMMATAARRLLVRIHPGDGVLIRQVHGYDAEPDGHGGVVVPLADLSEHGELSVLLELDVPGGASGQQRLAKVDVSFDDADGRGWLAGSDVSVESIDDRQRVDEARDWTVLKRVQEHRLAVAMKDSAELVSRGRAAEAQRRLDTAMDGAREVQAKVKDKKLGGYLKQAQQRHQAAPAAAAADRSTREHYKKSSKAQAFGMMK